MQEQLTLSLWATYLTALVLQASTLFVVKQVHVNICSALCSNPLTSIYLSITQPSISCWSVDSDRVLHLDNHIYISDSNNLCLHILHYKHNHPLSRYLRQNWTLELVCHKYVTCGPGQGASIVSESKSSRFEWDVHFITTEVCSRDFLSTRLRITSRDFLVYSQGVQRQVTGLEHWWRLTKSQGWENKRSTRLVWKCTGSIEEI